MAETAPEGEGSASGSPDQGGVARERRPRQDGVAVIDKPAGWTSHDVVAKSRGILGTRKIGHSGTLDPPATGVLLLGIGRATRLLRFTDGWTKAYVGEIVFGTETTTLDDTGDLVEAHPDMTVTAERLAPAVAALTGEIDQVPPMVSAVKIEGERLYEKARRGEEIDRPARRVTISALEVTPTDDPLVWRCAVSCSAGTYIRVVADDLGHALGGGAHLRNLRRTAIGPFTEADAHPLETPEVLPMVELFRGQPRFTVSTDLEAAVRVGKVLEGAALGVTGAGPWPVVDETGDLLAVYEAHRGDTVKPAVVVAG